MRIPTAAAPPDAPAAPWAPLEPKPARQSVTVRGALVAALATVLSAALSFAGLDVPHALLLEALTHAVALAGAAVALYGRLRARRPIG